MPRPRTSGPAAGSRDRLARRATRRRRQQWNLAEERRRGLEQRRQRASPPCGQRAQIRGGPRQPAASAPVTPPAAPPDVIDARAHTVHDDPVHPQLDVGERTRQLLRLPSEPGPAPSPASTSRRLEQRPPRHALATRPSTSMTRTKSPISAPADAGEGLQATGRRRGRTARVASWHRGGCWAGSFIAKARESSRRSRRRGASRKSTVAGQGVSTIRGVVAGLGEAQDGLDRHVPGAAGQRP